MRVAGRCCGRGEIRRRGIDRERARRRGRRCQQTRGVHALEPVGGGLSGLLDAATAGCAGALVLQDVGGRAVQILELDQGGAPGCLNGKWLMSGGELVVVVSIVRVVEVGVFVVGVRVITVD